MRYRKGKRAIILDHVGNYARFGMPDDDRKWTLEGKKKRKAGDFEGLPEGFYRCLNCYHIFSLKADNGEKATECPECGAAIPKGGGRNEILTDEETALEKITGFTISTKTPDECQSYKELLDYAQSHGYKSGWAYYQARNRGMM